MNVPNGFRFAAGSAGIRKSGAPDVGLIVSDVPAAAAAVFTTNRVVAAPVVLSREHLKSTRGRARAIIVNAGNANCGTPDGLRVSRATALAVSRAVRCPPAEVLVASTGVIGVPMDEQAVPRRVPDMAGSLAPNRYGEVASAMMTTDTRQKVAARTAGKANVLGMAKGAGMIHPRMATMLAFVLTDAAVNAKTLGQMTAAAVSRTFNRISVDGDTSTNDTVFVLANGAAGRVPGAALERALEEVMRELAIAIVADGEGARKLVTIDVAGARNEADADRIARAIANSPLVKTAVAGGDPNWGRILSAAGNSGVAIDPGAVSITMNGTPVCRRGLAAPFDEAALQAELQKASQIAIQVKVGTKKGSARFWTCDMTEEYIRINASYRT